MNIDKTNEKKVEWKNGVNEKKRMSEKKRTNERKRMNEIKRMNQKLKERMKKWKNEWNIDYKKESVNVIYICKNILPFKNISQWFRKIISIAIIDIF